MNFLTLLCSVLTMFIYLLETLMMLGYLSCPNLPLSLGSILSIQYLGRPKPQVFDFGSGAASVSAASASVSAATTGVSAATDASTVSSSGLLVLDPFKVYEGLETIFSCLLNRKQYLKLIGVLRFKKPYMVFKKGGYTFLVHHGQENANLPEGVAEYLESRPWVIVLSCYGASHQFKKQHICAVNAPLYVETPSQGDFFGPIPIENREGGYTFKVKVESKLVQL